MHHRHDGNRARIRIRFGFEGKLNEDFTAGVALASGNFFRSHDHQRDPDQFLRTQNIGLDRGYITYNPVASISGCL